MLRTVGFVYDFVAPATVHHRAAYHVPAGAVLGLEAEVVVDMRRAGAKVLDLTPKAMFAECGLEVPHRHALFLTQPCPDCRGDAVRMTACPTCNNTRRMVYL